MTINFLSAHAVPALPSVQRSSNPSPFGRSDNRAADTALDPATVQGVSGKAVVSARCARPAVRCGLCWEELLSLQMLQKGFWGRGSTVPVKKWPQTALEVTPSHSQLQRQPNKLAVSVTTRTCNEGSSGNTPVTKAARVPEQSIKNRNCCPPSPNKQQTRNGLDL